MLRLIEEGTYTLSETSTPTKILNLEGKKNFAWIAAQDIGEILINLHKKYKINNTLAEGKYRLYEVKDEPKLTDLLHLELLIGNGKWQGYLLPKGLPSEKEARHRIIPTEEVITKSTH